MRVETERVEQVVIQLSTTEAKELMLFFAVAGTPIGSLPDELWSALAEEVEE